MSFRLWNKVKKQLSLAKEKEVVTLRPKRDDESKEESWGKHGKKREMMSLKKKAGESMLFVNGFSTGDDHCCLTD